MVSRLEEIARELQQAKRPPVHLWNPGKAGEIDILIDAEGQWFYQGSPITRQRLVALFASILRYEDGNFFLVTPAEKLAISVMDVPFLVHQAEYLDEHWLVTTNTGTRVIVSAEHPVRLRRYMQQWLPYVNVRDGLYARASRSIYYQWVEQALVQRGGEAGSLILCSGDYEFEVARV